MFAAQRRWDVGTTQILARSIQSRAHLDRMHVRLLTELVQSVQDLIRSHAKSTLDYLRGQAVVRLVDRLNQLPDSVAFV